MSTAEGNLPVSFRSSNYGPPRAVLDMFRRNRNPNVFYVLAFLPKTEAVC